MEDYYGILGCQPDASKHDLKEAYQKLILTHHPDKVQQVNSGAQQKADTSMFQAATKAWKVLSDPSLRAEFDACWKQNSLAQKWPVQEDVLFEDLEWIEDEDVYCVSCRCGGNYELTKSDAFFKADIVPCGSCSLCVRVVYPPAQNSNDSGTSSNLPG